MSIKALADYTQYSKYAKYLPEKKRRETWNELIDRMFGMHEEFLGDKLENIKEEFYFAKDMIKKKRILGSQRSLQFGGSPIIKHHQKMYNCCAAYVDRVDFFKECMFLLLCGCGTGFSVQRHHVEKLPTIKPRDKGKKTFIIPDSIEGWADALGVLIQSYFRSDTSYYVYDLESYLDNYSGYQIEFDYSVIREEGSPISWGGKAPGPSGLRNAIEKIDNLLTEITAERGETKLRPIEAYDVIMHGSDAVLSGGVRRSATICLFSPDDEEMVNAKTGDWFIKNPQRGRSNNSALLIRNETTKEQFSNLMKSVKEFGEPGFVWADNVETLFNPCVTKDTMVMTNKGARSVESLIGEKFTALVDGKQYDSTDKGFFYTGNKPVYEITTKEGFTVKATDNHKFLVNKDGYKTWKPLKDIKIGETIIIHEHKDFSWEGEGTFGEGWLLGSLYGDGNICESRKCGNLDYWGESRFIMQERAINYINSENLKTYHNIKGSTQEANVGKQRVGSVGVYKLAKKYGISSKGKKVENSLIENTSSDFYRGFLQGWFDADGSVQGSQNKGVSVRLGSVNEDTLLLAQRMLVRLGIISKVYKNRVEEGYRKLPDGRGGLKKYWCKSSHELIISRECIKTYNERVGFSEPDKVDKLNLLLSQYSRQMYKSKFSAEVLSLTHIGNEDVYDCTINEIHAFDANCFYAHNCSEISFYNYDENGESGWGFCNLSEINGKKATTKEEFLEACKAAAILGTIQAAYTNFKYLSQATLNIVSRDALLGVSITGMMDNPKILFDPEIQKEGAKIVLKTNEEIAKKLGINSCARGCVIKPSGTASCILGTSSGIHPSHSKRYFRRVQANKLEFSAQHFKEVNPLAVEESVWSSNKSDTVLTFLCEVPDGAKTKNSIGAIELLECVKTTQQNWIEYGTRKTDERFKKYSWLRHNVSNTISVKPHEWDEVEEYIYKNRKWFAGISLLPYSGELDYPQAPFVSVLNEKELVQEYGKGTVFASGLIVDGLYAFDNNLWSACDCALGIGEKLEEMEEREEPVMPEKNGYTQKQWNEKLVQFTKDYANYIEYSDHYEKNKLKLDWIRRFKQFSERYCEGNIRRCTHMLKHVSIWKRWLDLKREYKDIDWSQVVEETAYEIDVSKIAGSACSGNGSCETGELGEAIQEKTHRIQNEIKSNPTSAA